MPEETAGTMKKSLHLIGYPILIIAFVTLNALCSSCEKENSTTQQYHKGNPITWEIRTHAVQTRILIDGFPTGIDFYEDGYYPDFDTTLLEGKPCHGQPYEAYILIDASQPGQQGDWVLFQTGYVSDLNVVKKQE